jgi:hypothetical protein
MRKYRWDTVAANNHCIYTLTKITNSFGYNYHAREKDSISPGTTFPWSLVGKNRQLSSSAEESDSRN